MKTGRKKWMPDAVQIEKIGEYAKTGATLEQIAGALGICERTLRDRMTHEPTVLASYKKGREVAEVLMSGKLYDMAMKGNVAAVIFWLKAQAGWRDRVELSGDPKRPLSPDRNHAPLSPKELAAALAEIQRATRK